MTDSITTDRLILRPALLEDVAATHALVSAPATTRFIGGTAPDAETNWTKCLRDIGHWTAYGYGIFSVLDRASGRLVGKVGLSHFGRGLGPDFDPFPEASWIMAEETHGKGLAFEATQAAHDWFNARHPGRSVCIIHPENTASLRLAERLGYRITGSASYKGDQPHTLER